VELISFENRLKERRKERRMMLIAEKKSDATSASRDDPERNDSINCTYRPTF